MNADSNTRRLNLMPNREWCPHCHGEGWDAEYYEEQTQSTSSGITYDAVRNAIREEAMDRTCRYCEGTGYVDNQEQEMK
jgi:DnaJ-class molecular chaperone